MKKWKMTRKFPFLRSERLIEKIRRMALSTYEGDGKKKADVEKCFCDHCQRIRRLVNPCSVASPFAGPTGYAAALKRKGFKKIGSGYYSMVFAKEGSNKVIKIGMRPLTDGWVRYVTWASKTGYAGGLAPKVYSYKYIKTKKTEEPFYVAVMEKLEKEASQTKGEEPMAVMADLAPFAMRHDNDNARALADLMVPGMAKFAVDFKEKFKDDSFDLHGGNFMFRFDGSFVITDPISRVKEEGETATRLRMKDLTPEAKAA